MMLAFGRCRPVVGISDVSCGNDDCTAAAAAVGEDVLTLLLDMSSPPFPVSPPGCVDDGVLSCSCLC